MARIRYIKPEFYSDTTLSDVSILARYLYIGLFCHLDKQGVFFDDPKCLKREVFPYDDEITVSKVKELLTELIDLGRLVRFEHRGKKYLLCPRFAAHQNFHKQERPRFNIPQEVIDSAGGGQGPNNGGSTVLEGCDNDAPPEEEPVDNGSSTGLAHFNDAASTTGTGTGTGIIYRNGKTEVAESISSPVQEKGGLKQCLDIWQDTLTHHKIEKPATLDEIPIQRLLKAKGFEATALALAGLRYEAASKDYDPSKHCRITRLQKPDIFDLSMNLGAQNKIRKREYHDEDLAPGCR